VQYRYVAKSLTCPSPNRIGLSNDPVAAYDPYRMFGLELSSLAYGLLS
jgi:hypothetical protein